MGLQTEFGDGLVRDAAWWAQVMGWWLALVVFPSVIDSMSGYGEGGIEVGLVGLSTLCQPDPFLVL